MDTGGRPRRDRARQGLEELRRQFATLLQECDRRGARRLLRRAIAEGIDRSEVMREVVGPAIDSVARNWDEHVVSLSQIYVIGLIVKDSVEALSTTLEPGKGVRGKVVIGTPQGDYHGLGKQIVATFLRAAGFEVDDLGLSQPPEAFVEAAMAEEADIIAVSALMVDTAMKVREVREEMKRRNADGTMLLVGGASFRYNPDLCKEVGADAMAPNAYEAIRVARGLLEKKK